MITIAKFRASEQRTHIGKYSLENRTFILWNQLSAKAQATLLCKSHTRYFYKKVYVSNYKRGEVKGFLRMRTKRPNWPGSEERGVECSEVQ
jgi:hypothetical protein